MLAVALIRPIQPAGAQVQPLLAPVDAAMRSAEERLHAGDRAEAERRYERGLAEAWRLVSAVEASSGHADLARAAARRSVNPLADALPPSAGSTVAAVPSQVAGLSRDARQDLRAGLSDALARAYFNLGVMAAQAGRFDHAAAMLEISASEAPDYAPVQQSLGVAYFSAQRYQQATGPLARVVAADPTNADARRMLALAWFNLEAYDKAAALLKDDPQRESDPSLQYSYGMALVRSGQAGDAQRIFSELLAAHNDSAPLTVILGEAEAEQGDFEAAIRLLQHAIELQPDVADANAALGTIYFRQGRLAEAEQALRAELTAHSESDRARQMLATVLDLQGRGAEAVPLLRTVLTARPEAHDARYLLGKILLAQGDAPGAVEQLKEAVRLKPDDASGHYQLAQAYRRLGQAALADQELAAYQSLKDTQRGRRP